MKRAATIVNPMEIYPLMRSLCRDSTILTFSFLAIVFLLFL